MIRQEKEDFHPRCDACDFQKLKKVENNATVRELRDKIEQLNFRLLESKNENQVLKRNLHLAKNMVYKEVGANCLDLQEIYKHGTDSDRKSRKETIILLKNKVQELQKYLNQLEGNTSVIKGSSSGDEAKEPVNAEKKAFYRTQLERRLAREIAEKDLNPLLEESYELRRALVAEKKRFAELKDEMNLLRAQLDNQINKNEEDMALTKSFQTIENQLQDTLAERAEIRRELLGSRARNKRLEDEISILKSELQVLQTKANDNNSLIESYTNKHKQIQEAVEAEKLIAQQNMDRYREELDEQSDNYEKNVALLDSLRDISHQRHLVLTELDKEMKSGVMICAKKQNDKNLSLSNRKRSLQKSNSTNLSEVEGIKNNSVEKDATEIESEKANSNGLSPVKQKLRLAIEMYKKLLEAAHKDKERLFYITQMQDRRMNEIALQVVETGRIISQKTAEKNKLEEKISRLQKTCSSKIKKGNIHSNLNNQFEEIKIRIDGQKEENEFLRNFLLSEVANLASDFSMYNGFLCETKIFFVDAFEDILSNFTKQKKTSQSKRSIENSENSNGSNQASSSFTI